MAAPTNQTAKTQVEEVQPGSSFLTSPSLPETVTELEEEDEEYKDDEDLLDGIESDEDRMSYLLGNINARGVDADILSPTPEIVKKE
jgi:glycerol-3-phosphate responsive antiterminator